MNADFPKCNKLLDAIDPLWNSTSYGMGHMKFSTDRVEDGYSNLPKVPFKDYIRAIENAAGRSGSSEATSSRAGGVSSSGGKGKGRRDGNRRERSRSRGRR